LEQADLDRVGCFTYSAVQGAKANALPGHVAADVMEQRKARLMRLQHTLSAQRLAGRIGSTLEVLVDRVEGARAVARSYADAPEIDGLVYIDDGQYLVPGDFAKVRITASGDHDLYGNIACC
ncbi:MAG: 30S ribosomal protein S12 methylthiotransferase RimO, partial [Burkholderiales bacterium]